MDLEKLTLKKTSGLLSKKELSALDLAKAFLERSKKLNKKLNAYITVLEKEALEQARQSDKRITNNEKRGLLDGVPIAIKDNLCLENSLTTCGSRILENFIAPYDATVIEKLKKAGTIFLGKTNMDEFAMGSSTETSYFGPTKNPWDEKRVPGGSSGGSAAAVASGMALAAIGSDTGGSIRQPASFCGVVGFKPTYGAVSRYGLIAMASSFDQIGPIAKNVSDARILFQAISDYDEKDSTSLKIKNLKLNENCKLKIENLRIGIPKEYFVTGIDKNVEKIIKAAIKKYQDLGAKIEEISLPHTKYALAAYYIIMPSEVSSNLARYDGIKYGLSRIKNYELRIKNLIDTYFQIRADGFGDEAKRRIILGTFALSAGYYDAFYLKAKKVQSAVKKDFDKVFSKVDFILTPTSPTTAFKIGEKIDDPISMYLSDIFTVPVNLAGLPAISLPCGLVQGLPVGLQIIGPQFSDFGVLKLAQIYEESYVNI